MTTTSAARPAISVTGLQKSFGGKVVLDGIDLTVQEGTIFALLGPNGAGKTTTVHILSTLIPADGGEAQVAGHDVAAEAESGPNGAAASRAAESARSEAAESASGTDQ